MSIIKAFLFTILVVIIWSLIQLSILLPIKFFIGKPKDFTHYFGITNIVSTVGAFLIIFYFFWKPKLNLKKALKFRNYNPNIYLYLPLVAVGLLLATQPFSDFIHILDYYQDTFVHQKPKVTDNEFVLIYAAISTLIISPIVEELFYRKFLLGKLAEKYNLMTSLLISSICFSLMHVETPSNLMPTFIGGMILGFIYMKTKKIGYSIILHSVINTFVITFNNSNLIDEYWFYGFNYNLTYWLLFLFGIVLTLWSVRRINIISNS